MSVCVDAFLCGIVLDETVRGYFVRFIAKNAKKMPLLIGQIQMYLANGILTGEGYWV
jgi:hypothetical protein